MGLDPRNLVPAQRELLRLPLNLSLLHAIAHEDVRHPIVGFMVKDRLGQIVFGDNTFLSRSNVELGAPAGSRIVAGFEFTGEHLHG